MQMLLQKEFITYYISFFFSYSWVTCRTARSSRMPEMACGTARCSSFFCQIQQFHPQKWAKNQFFVEKRWKNHFYYCPFFIKQQVNHARSDGKRIRPSTLLFLTKETEKDKNLLDLAVLPNAFFCLICPAATARSNRIFQYFLMLSTLQVN